MALSTNEEGVEGYIQPPHKIQPLHTHLTNLGETEVKTRSDRKFKYSERWDFWWDRKYHLGGTESASDMNVGDFGETEKENSVRPI